MAAAAGLPRFGVFVYSSFCVSPMSGDLGGNRITLSRFADGDSLVFEYTDGSTHALIASALTFGAKSRSLRFDVDVEGEPRSTISGSFSPDGKELSLRGLPFGSGTPSTLAQVKNFAAPLKPCVPPASP